MEVDFKSEVIPQITTTPLIQCLSYRERSAEERETRERVKE